MNTPIFPSDLSATHVAEVLRQHAILSQGVAAILPAKDAKGLDGLHYKLIASMKTGVPLKVKLGMDPTAPDLHLGHTVVLQGMRRFQDLGHIAQPLIGDYTARIGDPAGRNKTRPPLQDEDIDRNAKTYFEQVFKVLVREPAKLELLYNSMWLKDLSFADTIKLCAQVTVAQLIAREDFAQRLASNTPISMHELLYPIMQGYDSVAMACDIEFGGTDQTFNCLMGRQLMEAKGMVPQVVMTFPLLVGLDGKDKMSKSKGNYIALTDSAADIYGKTMSIPDALISQWFALLAPDVSYPENPYAAKHLLAHTLTSQYYDAEVATGEAERFKMRFSQRKLDEVTYEAFVIYDVEPITVAKVLKKLQWDTTMTAIRNKIAHDGALKVNGEKVTDPHHLLYPGVSYTLVFGRRDGYVNIYDAIDEIDWNIKRALDKDRS